MGGGAASDDLSGLQLPPVVVDALVNLQRMVTLLLFLAEGDGAIKATVGGSREVIACLLRTVRPAPYSLLHHAAFAPIVLKALKALKLLSSDPVTVEVLDACGALGTLVPFLVRESLPQAAPGAVPMLGAAPSSSGGVAGAARPTLAATAGPAAAASSSATVVMVKTPLASTSSSRGPVGLSAAAARGGHTAPGAAAAAPASGALRGGASEGGVGGSSPLRSKEVAVFILHIVFNMCRVNAKRQAAAAAAGVIPVLTAVLQSRSNPLRPLALPVFCDLAHAGAKTRQLMWESGSVPLLVSLLASDLYWATHALNALADWVTQDPSKRLAGVLERPASQDALLRLFINSAADGGSSAAAAGAAASMLLGGAGAARGGAALALPRASGGGGGGGSGTYAQTVLPHLLTLLDRVPRLASSLAAREDWCAVLLARLNRCAESKVGQGLLMTGHVTSLGRVAVSAEKGGDGQHAHGAAGSASVTHTAHPHSHTQSVFSGVGPGSATSGSGATVAAGMLVMVEDARVVKLLLALLRVLFEASAHAPGEASPGPGTAGGGSAASSSAGGPAAGFVPGAAASAVSAVSASEQLQRLQRQRDWLLAWDAARTVERLAVAAQASGRVMLLSLTDSLLAAFRAVLAPAPAQ
jgi:hypothetical protein